MKKNTTDKSMTTTESMLPRSGTSSDRSLTLRSRNRSRFFRLFGPILIGSVTATPSDETAALPAQKNHPLSVTPRARDDDRDAEKHQRRGRRHAEHDNQGGFVAVSFVRRRHNRQQTFKDEKQKKEHLKWFSGKWL